jgi:hypothetical protein
MRRIPVENSRRRHRLKHGGQRGRVDLDCAQPAEPETDDDLHALNEALEKFAAKDPAKVQPVQARASPG